MHDAQSAVFSFVGCMHVQLSLLKSMQQMICYDMLGAKPKSYKYSG